MYFRFNWCKKRVLLSCYPSNSLRTWTRLRNRRLQILILHQMPSCPHNGSSYICLHPSTRAKYEHPSLPGDCSSTGRRIFIWYHTSSLFRFPISYRFSISPRRSCLKDSNTFFRSLLWNHFWSHPKKCFHSWKLFFLSLTFYLLAIRLHRSLRRCCTFQFRFWAHPWPPLNTLIHLAIDKLLFLWFYCQ